MRITITIKCDNAAFVECGEGAEVARILRRLSDSLDGNPIDPGDECRLIDFNGNAVGTYKATGKKLTN